ncbi:MAG: class I tRNA ligase family protein [Oscillospiraceae bacterium]
MRKELPKVYDPREVEPHIYQMWMDNGCFKADADPKKKPFSIVMPPPNVTGQLHMGHAMDSTLQDILTRFKRMQELFRPVASRHRPRRYRHQIKWRSDCGRHLTL